jgi:nucleotide-binding universal stress UspA family protein
MAEEIRRIVLATSLSSDSLGAVEYIAGLAREHASELVLVHVIEPLPRGIARWYEPSRLLGQYAENARNKLEHFEKQALALYPRCRSELHFGTAAQVIADVAKKLAADLIVVSAHQPTGIFDLVLGGLAERLIRRTACPVLAVRWGGGSSHETEQPDHFYEAASATSIPRSNSRLTESAVHKGRIPNPACA